MQFARYGGDGVEKFAGFFDGHVEDLADVFAFVLDFERFAVVAFAVADLLMETRINACEPKSTAAGESRAA